MSIRHFMNVYLMSDLEGATVVTRFDTRKTLPGRLFHTNIDNYIKQLTNDINAAISGAAGAGASVVAVCDGHGNSILEEDRPLEAYPVPSGKCWMPELDESFDAVLMIGFHAKSGNNKAVLSHTFS